MIDVRLRALLVTIVAMTSPLAAVQAATHAPAEDAPGTPALEDTTASRQGAEQTDTQFHVFKVGADAALDLTNISGDVRVTGNGGDEIRIEATRRVRHTEAEEARRLLQELRVDITRVGGRVEVRTVYPQRPRGSRERGLSARVDYVVTVPAAAAVSVKTISGHASVARVKGEVRAEAVSGDVLVTGASNLAVARSVSGNVTATDSGGVGTLTLGTVSGTVVATGLRARALECGSVSGDIRLSGAAVERLQARSVSGGIEFGDALARGGRYDLGSHSGNIRIVLASETGFDLDAGTFSGSIRSDFPVTLRSPGAGTRERRETDRTIRGAFGDGSAVLSLKTFSGTIVIARK